MTSAPSQRKSTGPAALASSGQVSGLPRGRLDWCERGVDWDRWGSHTRAMVELGQAGQPDEDEGEPGKLNADQAEPLDQHQELQRVTGELLAARSEAEQARRMFHAAQAQYQEMATSAAYQAARRWRAALERAAPPGTQRRIRYTQALRAMLRMAGWLDRPGPPGGVSQDAPGSRLPPATESPTPADGHIELPTSDLPEVSIVIPVHGQWAFTESCLRALVRHGSAVPLEVIVVDDTSPDDTAGHLRSVTGIRVVSLQRHVGCLGALNAGIRAAVGRYVVLLNNDTEVQAGWLEALMSAADQAPDIGVVGAKLVFPGGTVQEAGSIVWSDGSAHNFGRGGPAAASEVAFLREVDYCSGACLLVRAELLEQLGGLDDRFAPAYYEDTDLCFAARQAGYRVLYQPDAVVVHHEGASHGTDLSSGGKRHQQVNQRVFADKWEQTLMSHPPVGTAPRLASWRRPRGRVLVVDQAVPKPDHDSGSCRMSQLMRAMNDLGMAVTLLPDDPEWPHHLDLPEPYTHMLRSAGIEVLTGPEELSSYLKAVGADLRMVLLSRPKVALAYLLRIRTHAPNAVLVYDTVDLHFRREGRRADLTGDAGARRIATTYQQAELFLANAADATWVVTEEERASLGEANGGIRSFVVPNVHPPGPEGKPFAERSGLLFVGTYVHPPNRDAVTYLVEEIIPAVRRRLPNVKLSVAGSVTPPDALSLQADGVEVLGWVPDLGGLYQQSRLFVAPLRYGAGMKGKVGESMAHGLPVVVSSIGAEGIGIVSGRDALVADGTEAFADAVERAYTDQHLWEQLATNGRHIVDERFSPRAARCNLARVLGELGVTEASEPLVS